MLKGLDVAGVPNILKKTICPFRYNDFETLKKIVEEKVGIIKMEVIRYDMPKIIFKRVTLADKNNIILIFDECTTGSDKLTMEYIKCTA